MYRDSTILNSIRNYISNSMQNEMYVNAQLASYGNAGFNVNTISNEKDNVKYITCGSSVCGIDGEPYDEIVKWR